MKKKINCKSFLFCLIILFVTSTEKLIAAASANLNQARNGTDASPTNPVNWVNGNLGGSQAHYIEGMSSPYQCVMTGLTIGLQATLTIGYDIKNSGKNAFDYLTYYSRITPHVFGLHSVAETIDPLTGSGLGAGTPFTSYTIPVPSSAGSPVSGQPGNSFNALSSGEREMLMFNGTIDSIYYLVQGNLTLTQSETQIVVKFTPSSATAVLAWGGHIASRNDWGSSGGGPRSAGGISGSPFHMRLVSWSYGSLGSQDRSLSGGSVSAPSAPLPVELVHLAVHAVESSNLVEWTTATEFNNDYFTIERSAGITNYEPIATVSGAGNSSTIRDYSWSDNLPLPGLSYYRLVQTDYDGSKKIFGPICVQANGIKLTLSEFKAYVAVSSDNVVVSFYSPAKGDVQLDILSIDGRLIQSEKLSAKEGTNFTHISGTKLASKGVYFIRLSQDENALPAQKIVKN